MEKERDLYHNEHQLLKTEKQQSRNQEKQSQLKLQQYHKTNNQLYSLNKNLSSTPRQSSGFGSNLMQNDSQGRYDIISVTNAVNSSTGVGIIVASGLALMSYL